MDIDAMQAKDFHGALQMRVAPTLRPTLLGGHLVAVTDTNALARKACASVRAGSIDALFPSLSLTGRSNTFVAAHIPGELVDHLSDVAASTRVDLAAAEHALWNKILPAMSVVDLPIRDFLHPRLRPLLNADPRLPKIQRGDPDDVGTAALAEFLAPAVILSADSVFSRFGFSSVAAEWIDTAHDLLRAAGIEASLSDATMLVELALQAFLYFADVAIQLVRSYPLLVLSLLTAALYFAIKSGWLHRGSARAAVIRLRQVGEPFFQFIEAAAGTHQLARRALTVVEPYGAPTVEQRVGRFLARRGRALTPAALRDELLRAGFQVSAAELKRTMLGHPAFLRQPGDLYSVGRLAARHPPTE